MISCNSWKKKKKEFFTLNKLIYVGYTVSQLRKLEMYKFHYGFMKDLKIFKLLYSDTDSFIYEIVKILMK